MTRPKCCQTAEEADTVRWDGFRWTVALYIDQSGGAVEAPAEFCPFCGEKLPPGPDKHHPMRRYAYEKPEELLELYYEAMRHVEAAERRADELAEALRRKNGDVFDEWYSLYREAEDRAEAEEWQRLRLMKNMLENGKGAARRLAELETKLSAHQKAERTVGWCSQKLAGLESLLGRLHGEVGNIRNTLELDGMVPEDEDGG